jgi:hypothetical protein
MIRGSPAEEALRQKLHKIEALFAGAATAGEKAAAGAAAERIRARLGTAACTETPEEMRFSVPDIWSPWASERRAVSSSRSCGPSFRI